MKRILSIILLATMILSSFNFTVFASEETIITTSDSLCKLEGSGWAESSNEKVAGPTNGTSWYTAEKSATATYDASALGKGNYGVYIFLTPWGQSADKVDVTITASGKSTTVTTDGLDGGVGNRHWVFLGKYDFDGSKGDKIVQKAAAGSSAGMIRTSGVKFIKDDPNTESVGTGSENLHNAPATTPSTPAPSTPIDSNDGIIITSSDSRFKMSGIGWTESTNASVAGPTGGSSWWISRKNCVASYDASGLENGKYGVYVFVTPWGAAPEKVDIGITASGNTTVVTMDAKDGAKDGDRHWAFVGIYDFDGSKGDCVTQQINEGSGAGAMRTSGVKFVKDDTNTAKVNGIIVGNAGASDDSREIQYQTVPETGFITMGTLHAGFSKEGDWKQSGLSMPVEGKAFYGVDKGTGIWYPYLNKAENVEIFYFKPKATETEDPALKVEIFTEGEIKTVTIDFTQPPTEWYSLGKYNFSGDGTEYIKCTGSGTGTARLTGLKFTKEETAVDVSTLSAFYGTDLHILERFGMLIGEGDGITEEYIKKVPTRVQAAIMVLRLNGVDKEAAAYTGTDNFADADLEAWAKPYLAYLKAHPEFGLIGTGGNKFEPTANIDEQAYAKILLTALGYEYNKDFTWDETLSFAAEKDIAKAESGAFNVKDLAIMTESALNLNCKNGGTLLAKLVAARDGVKDEGVYGTVLPAELKAARDAARDKKRGIIYNNDGNDVYKAYPEYPDAFDISNLDGSTINAENFLGTNRTNGLKDSQVGTVMYCTGVFSSYHHESVGVTDVRVRDWARALKEYTGKDSLTTMLDYVHSLDKELFWSMRLNDTHDHQYQEDELDPWKKANMDLLMYRKADAAFMSYGYNRWSSVDYALPEVRQHVYDILKDTLTRYDIDGLELDFTRFMVYFKEVTKGIDVYPENVERMNNLVRMVRDMTEKISIERGKPILLAINVPNSLEYCKAIGLDIEKWMKEGLFDIASIGDVYGLWQSWEDSIKEYDGYDVQVYAVMDELSFRSEEDRARRDVAKEAAIAWEAGADGIFLYNFFNTNDAMFDTVGTPETCGPVDPNYKSVFKPAELRFLKDAVKYRKYQ